MMRFITILFTLLLGSCSALGNSAPDQRLSKYAGLAGLGCHASSGADCLARQRAQVQEALRPVEAMHTASLSGLERISPDVSPHEAARELEKLRSSYDKARQAVLQPLAAQGNAEALMGLAVALRDSSAPEDIRQWLALVTRASQAGHPVAHDELVRWYWHQKGDGSLREVQKNRAIALAFATKAADAGNMYGLSRIAVYISGDVHQYPADLRLARRVAELCARTGYDFCQQALAGGYGQSAGQAYLWLSRLAAKHPDRFAARLELAWSKLTVDEQTAARQAVDKWSPVPWSTVKPEWEEVRKQILAHGEASVGEPSECTTSTPWCRGALVMD